MNASDIRRKYIDFFVQRGHTHWPGDSLVPTDDPTLLFTGAGMNQFKDMFLGKGHLPFKRAVTLQKCVRTGDIDNVGTSPFHHSFFEMLGNFSFGDYFKREAISWAWEFLTGDMGLPERRLRATIYKDDHEAYDVWRNVVGLPDDYIRRFDEDENFWPANVISQGPNGVCGPCSEIYFDHTDGHACGRPDCGVDCPCKRFVEVWNLVFTQYDRQDGGKLVDLPSGNIDTGMGLERMAAVMQGVRSSAETDLFVPIIKAITELTDIEYKKNSPQGVCVRRIADHVRAVAFSIGDGALPGNSGRGYVVRRLIRRAIRDAVELGRGDPFLYQLVPVIVDVMKVDYPDIVPRRESIALVIKSEEERFHQTLDQGERLLAEMVDDLRESGKTVLAGADAFRLYDTYGFPVEMTEAIVAEQGLTVDRPGFDAAMDRQRELARAGSTMTEVFDTGPLSIVKELTKPTEFVGYAQHEADATVMAIIAGEEVVDQLEAGVEATVVLDRTPFYGEAGGQVGDTGKLLLDGGREFNVANTRRSSGYFLHDGRLNHGTLHRGEKLHAARVDRERRDRIASNHTATHLLHWALRLHLGERAEQRGSLVAPERLRFDFTHFAPVTPEQLKRIEDSVNEAIFENLPVTTYETTLEQARKDGVTALFAEKYGERVRVVQTGTISRELCGGTHLDRTGSIGLLKIIGEGAISAGTRRIEAVTGQAALDLIAGREQTLRRLSQTLGAPEAGLAERAEKLLDEIKSLRKDLAAAKQRKAPAVSIRQIIADAPEANGARIVCHKLEDASIDDLRAVADTFKKLAPSGVMVLASAVDGKVAMIAAVTKDLNAKGIRAGDLVKELAPIVGGGGGGRPDVAQAGGKDVAKIGDMLKAAEETIRKRLS